MPERKVRRCAIYTRKSTDEGLEQGFNSLDAQHDACAAYILSQTHEGWEAIGEHYDDGGWSGGTMDRPALRQLLADINAGKIDTVVVYKVDRLTRSLADFAKIVELFDKQRVTFVSVTQAFNTTDSMGRLTLNVLLSFAQFEREVTAERIRDKVAASKKKGIWMGGSVPLGYRVEDRKLHVIEEEAKVVRHVFERYCALQSIADLADELARDGYRTRARRYRTGRSVGGIAFGKGALAHMLQNPLVIGRTRHKDKVYEGEHEAIVPIALWERAQEIMNVNRRTKRLGVGKKDPSMLVGMLFDGEGRPMSPSHARKPERRYRYYVSGKVPGAPRKAGWSIAAGEIERLVCDAIARWLAEPVSAEIASRHPVSRLREIEAERKHFATLLTEAIVPARREALMAINTRIVVDETRLSIMIDALGAADPVPRRAIDVAHDLLRTGHDKTIIPTSVDTSGTADPTLLKLIAHAYAAQRMLLTGKEEPTVARFSKRHLYRLLHLGWLAPDIIAAIVEGRHPRHLNARKLLRTNGIPLDWAGQRKMLGLC